MKPEGIDTSPAASHLELQIEFDNNTLLSLLFGQHDQNLARIEQKLGVILASRGNQLAISGPAWAAEAAHHCLDSLYGKLKDGTEIDQGEVDAAIRWASEFGPDVGGKPRDKTDGKTGGKSKGKSGGRRKSVARNLAPRDMVINTRKRKISPRTPAQADYLRAMEDYEMVFSLGPAGTGKTYLAVATAVSLLMAGEVDRIILSRPAVEAGEHLGFLPGDLREKIDPYLRPLYDALYDMMPTDQAAKRLASGEIEVAPLAFMRGRTLARAFIILDEAQNTTPVQMKMCLTRLGENSRMVVTGDLSQVDLPVGMRSGLVDAIETLEGVEGLTFVRFTDADMVRHTLVTRVVRAYEKAERAKGHGGKDNG